MSAGYNQPNVCTSIKQKRSLVDSLETDGSLLFSEEEAAATMLLDEGPAQVENVTLLIGSQDLYSMDT